ncbi:helix-turn-helix domain-containing protein [Micromonospora orduensis]|uniref:Helix-turn-helix domain-containing protein n=1 Tax=Micromonospora orduensis TaxID=1420891 RepID=A0A5C4QNZ1_9ACTN|nr:helix-turn-helix transcriptional regulator [Micromonospora orduensis]TNH28772.1 helix-turn-helix domain-containing protein [Micromonospora orduensis]
MTGRPEKPIDPLGGSVAQFAMLLRRLRQQMGAPSYRSMASKSFYSVAALSVAAGGTRFPSWECTEAYVRACGVDSDDRIAHWKKVWATFHRQIQDEKRARKEAAQAFAANLEETDVPVHVLGPPAPLPVPGEQYMYTDRVRYVDADPAEVETLEEFLTALDQMRVEKGFSLRQVAERARKVKLPGTDVSGGLSRSQLHDMLNGRAPLRKRHVLAFLMACEVSQDRIPAWIARLYQLHDHDRRVRAALAALKTRPDEDLPVTINRRTGKARRDGRALNEGPAVVNISPEVPAAETDTKSVPRGKHRQARGWTGLFRRAALGLADEEDHLSHS